MASPASVVLEIKHDRDGEVLRRQIWRGPLPAVEDIVRLDGKDYVVAGAAWEFDDLPLADEFLGANVTVYVR